MLPGRRSTFAMSRCIRFGNTCLDGLICDYRKLGALGNTTQSFGGHNTSAFPMSVSHRANAPDVEIGNIINSSPGRGATSVGSAAICCLSCVKASSASVVQRKSPFFAHFLSVLNKGSDLSADLLGICSNLWISSLWTCFVEVGGVHAHTPATSLLFDITGLESQSCGIDRGHTSNVFWFPCKVSRFRCMSAPQAALPVIRQRPPDRHLLLRVGRDESDLQFSSLWLRADLDGTARIAEIPWSSDYCFVWDGGDLITIKFILAGRLGRMFVKYVADAPPSMSAVDYPFPRVDLSGVRIGGGFGKFETSVASIFLMGSLSVGVLSFPPTHLTFGSFVADGYSGRWLSPGVVPVTCCLCAFLLSCGWRLPLNGRTLYVSSIITKVWGSPVIQHPFDKLRGFYSFLNLDLEISGHAWTCIHSSLLSAPCRRLWTPYLGCFTLQAQSEGSWHTSLPLSKLAEGSQRNSSKPSMLLRGSL
ncbi:hypothetical protein Tco_0317382 [Tanacetum coccineum]